MDNMEERAAVARTKLAKSLDEAMRVQIDLDEANEAIMRADAAGDHPAIARWYVREAELLHWRTEIADRVAAIATALWLPDESPGAPPIAPRSHIAGVFS